MNSIYQPLPLEGSDIPVVLVAAVKAAEFIRCSKSLQMNALGALSGLETVRTRGPNAA